MIRFQCPKCEKSLRVEDADAETSVECPSCGASLRVPAAEEEDHIQPTPKKSRSSEDVAAAPLTPARPARDEEPDEADRPTRFDVKPFKPDGGFTIPGVILMIVLEMIGGLILGLVTSIVGGWFYIIIIFPILIGLAVGGIGLLGVRFGKVRNPVLGGLIGFFGGCVAMFAMQLSDYVGFLGDRETNRAEYERIAGVGVPRPGVPQGKWQRPDMAPPPPPSAAEVREVREMLQVDNFFEYVDFAARRGVVISRGSGTYTSDQGINLGHVGTYVYWGIELLIVGGVSLAIMAAGAGKPFCLRCNSWKKQHTLGTLEPPADRIVRSLEKGRPDRLEDHDPGVGKEGLTLFVHVCPKCREESPVEVRLQLVTKDNRGRNKFKDLIHLTYPGEVMEVLEDLFPHARI